MQFETLLEYDKIADQLRKNCEWFAWNEVEDPETFCFTTKIQYMLVVKLLINLKILPDDYLGFFPKYDRKKVEQEFLLDDLWEIGECLSELRDIVYFMCGWEVKIYNIGGYMVEYEEEDLDKHEEEHIIQQYLEKNLNEKDQADYGEIVQRTFEYTPVIFPILYILINKKIGEYIKDSKNPSESWNYRMENFIRKLIRDTNNGIPYNLIISDLTTNKIVDDKFISTYVEFYVPETGEQVDSYQIELSYLLKIGILKCAIDIILDDLEEK